MPRRIRPRLSYANVMVTVVAFLVLGGGTALAAFVINSNSEVAPDTIAGHSPPAGDHANIIGGSVTTADLAAAAVTTAKIAPDAVNASKVADRSLPSAKLRDVGFMHAKTSKLSTGGGGAMFSVGRVGLSSFCTNNGGTLSAGIEVGVDEIGPDLVIGDSTIALQPFDVQFIVAVGDNSNVKGQERSFSILDRNGTSASGVASAVVDPANGHCVVTAEAVG